MLQMFQGYGDLMYQTSQVDIKQKKVVDQYTSKGTDFITQGKWLECFEVREVF